MTALDFKNNNSFTVWACNHLSISEDAQGNPIVSCPDTNGHWYQVNCEESRTSITPTSCSCGKSNCKHQTVVASFYARMYKQPVVSHIEAEVKNRMMNAALTSNRGFSIMR